MRIFFDENLDWRLGRELPEHDVESVTQLGWAGIQNGLLLRKANESGYEVLVTMDTNIAFQQNLVGSPIKVVVLRAHSNRLADTRPLMPKLLQTLPQIRTGMVNVIE
jgi:predicted nuclease of predicted toxin-antitoxin system